MFFETNLLEWLNVCGIKLRKNSYSFFFYNTWILNIESSANLNLKFQNM